MDFFSTYNGSVIKSYCTTLLKQSSVLKLRYVNIIRFIDAGWVLSYFEDLQRHSQLKWFNISGYVELTENSNFPHVTELRQWLLLNKSKEFKFQMKLSTNSIFTDKTIQKSVLDEYGQAIGDDSLVKHGKININYRSVSFSDSNNEEDNSIGRVMLSQGHLTELQLEASLQLQEMVLNRVITYRRAVKLIKLVGRLQAPLSQIMDESKTLDMVFKLLRSAGLASEKVIREVACQITDFEDTVAEAMLARGFIQPVHFRIGLVCLEKMHRSELTEAKAAFVVNYCARHPGRELEMFSRVNWSELKRIDIQSDLLSTL